MQLEVKNRQGKVVDSIDVAESVFGIEANQAVVHQVMVGQRANERQGTVETKRRSDVAGGGAKPFRQKGTGRARQGTIRAAQFRGGGVVFGPHARSFSQVLPKRIRQAALRSVISARVAAGQLKVIDAFSLPEAKTKHVVALLSDLDTPRDVLLLTSGQDPDLYRSARNLPDVNVMTAADASAMDLLRHSTIVTTPDGAKTLSNRLDLGGSEESRETGKAEAATAKKQPASKKTRSTSTVTKSRGAK